MVGLFRGEEAINRLVSAVGARFIEGYAWKLLEGRNTHALHTQFGSGVASSMDQKDKTRISFFTELLSLLLRSITLPG